LKVQILNTKNTFLSTFKTLSHQYARIRGLFRTLDGWKSVNKFKSIKNNILKVHKDITLSLYPFYICSFKFLLYCIYSAVIMKDDGYTDETEEVPETIGLLINLDHEAVSIFAE